MGQKRQRVELRVDAYTRVCLTVIAGLLTLLVLGLWADGVPTPGEAFGLEAGGKGIPNAGQQREQIVKELKANGAKLDRLVRLFEGGKAKVQITGQKAGNQGVVRIKAR